MLRELRLSLLRVIAYTHAFALYYRSSSSLSSQPFPPIMSKTAFWVVQRWIFIGALYSCLYLTPRAQKHGVLASCYESSVGLEVF